MVPPGLAGMSKHLGQGAEDEADFLLSLPLTPMSSLQRLEDPERGDKVTAQWLGEWQDSGPGSRAGGRCSSSFSSALAAAQRGANERRGVRQELQRQLQLLKVLTARGATGACRYLCRTAPHPPNEVITAPAAAGTSRPSPPLRLPTCRCKRPSVL